jgi:hypothetical protein
MITAQRTSQVGPNTQAISCRRVARVMSDIYEDVKRQRMPDDVWENTQRIAGFALSAMDTDAQLEMREQASAVLMTWIQSSIEETKTYTEGGEHAEVVARELDRFLGLVQPSAIVYALWQHTAKVLDPTIGLCEGCSEPLEVYTDELRGTCSACVVKQGQPTKLEAKS